MQVEKSQSQLKSSQTDDLQPQMALREWLAGIEMHFAGSHPTVLRKVEHYGPLRVQRPFYPEENGCCHVYLLHPPGGMVIGDKLSITLNIQTDAHALITTPSAGKIYSAKQSAQTQGQSIHAKICAGGILEWLPQETIIFNGANARLVNKVILEPEAKFFGWDIARLGRVASNDYFEQGQCLQAFELWQNDEPLHIERVNIKAQCESYKQAYGLQHANTTGTLIGTFTQSRDQIDALLQSITEKKLDTNGKWGITQKEALFIARYLGDSVTDCRKGFEYIWQSTRKIFNGKQAVPPRIWNT